MTVYKSDEYLKMIVEREKSVLRSNKSTWCLNHKSPKVIKSNITYENAKTLIDVFSNIIDDKEKTSFINALSAEIWGSEEEYLQNRSGEIIAIGASALAFYTLTRLGYSKRAIESTYNRIEASNCILVFRLILDLLSEDYNYYTIEQYNQLIEQVNRLRNAHKVMLDLRDEILSKTTEIGFRIVKEEIQGVNIEVNRDKESVIKKFSILGMNEEYEKFLNELDVYICSSSGLVASGMISNFRTFWEKIIIELSKKIVAITGVQISTNEKSTIANSRLYIKNMLELSDADNSLISRFVDILHTEGGHAFTSNVEYFRLSRNIGVEILLLLLTKTESLKMKINPQANQR